MKKLVLVRTECDCQSDGCPHPPSYRCGGKGYTEAWEDLAGIIGVGVCLILMGLFRR